MPSCIPMPTFCVMAPIFTNRLKPGRAEPPVFPLEINSCLRSGKRKPADQKKSTDLGFGKSPVTIGRFPLDCGPVLRSPLSKEIVKQAGCRSFLRTDLQDTIFQLTQPPPSKFHRRAEAFSLVHASPKLCSECLKRSGTLTMWCSRVRPTGASWPMTRQRGRRCGRPGPGTAWWPRSRCGMHGRPIR
jgi:hypothetical protein